MTVGTTNLVGQTSLEGFYVSLNRLIFLLKNALSDFFRIIQVHCFGDKL